MLVCCRSSGPGFVSMSPHSNNNENKISHNDKHKMIGIQSSRDEKEFGRNVEKLGKSVDVPIVFGRNGEQTVLVLSGCGVYDGSEIHEASAILVHLSRGGAEVSMFAPDKQQMHVIDHTKGEPAAPNRNVLIESARIARGKISPLSDLTADKFSGVIFPGGFGAAKNLSTFAVDGADMKVDPDVERVLKDFHSSKKPIGLCCIAPVLAANVIKDCEVTVGSNEEEGGKWPHAGTAGAIEKMGAKHVKKDVTEAHTDVKNKIVSAPAFMCDTAVHEIFDGIGRMVDRVLKLA